MIMRTLRLESLVLIFALLLAGCESMPQNMRERFSPVPPKVATFEADARTTFFAAQLAFKRLDFNLTRTALGGHRIEAASRINTSAAFQDSRQLLAYVSIEDVGTSQCEVSLRLIEAIEGRGLGGASELALREHGFYETYFAVLKQVLEEQGREAVARVSLSTRRFWPENSQAEIGEVNGQDALILRENGQPWSVVTIEVEEERIRAIRVIVNPDKLTRV